MHAVIAKGLSIAALSSFLAGYGLASPLSSKLLSLVPPSAEIVAGFENHAFPRAHGRLLLTTHNNRLDLQDWEALTGVDSRRIFNEVIEVAATNPSGSLTEHVLLVAGQFDRERIFQSLEENGAQAVDFEGQQALLIKPLARERGDMLDNRLLVILDNRTGILGTQELVGQTLRRYADHAQPDAVLEERLSQLRPDVTSWNALSGPSGRGINFLFAEPHSAWAELQQDTNLLLVGVHFGSKIRVDFSLYGENASGAEFYSRKASFFTTALVAGPEPRTERPHSARQPEKLSVEANHVQGSVELSQGQFEAWCGSFSRIQAPDGQGPVRGN